MQLYRNLVWGGSFTRVVKAGSFVAFSKANTKTYNKTIKVNNFARFDKQTKGKSVVLIWSTLLLK